MSTKFRANPLIQELPQNPEGAIADIIGDQIGGIAAARPFAKMLTGARCILKVNQKVFAFAFSVSWNIETQVDEIWTIDDWNPYELAPKRCRVSGTIGSFHVPGKGPTKELIQANILSFMMHKYITIEVRDRSTNILLFRTNRAMITSRQQSNTNGDISKMNLNFVGIGFQDELVPALPSFKDSDNKDPLGNVVNQVGEFFK